MADFILPAFLHYAGQQARFEKEERDPNFYFRKNMD